MPGGAFVVADVWRSEGEGRAFVGDVLQPLLAEVGLAADEPTVRDVWSFARP